jgi:hypothetical protein
MESGVPNPGEYPTPRTAPQGPTFSARRASRPQFLDDARRRTGFPGARKADELAHHRSLERTIGLRHVRVEVGESTLAHSVSQIARLTCSRTWIMG